MTIKKIHNVSGLLIAIFVSFHLGNHISSIYGAKTHIEIMTSLRVYYRNPFIEFLLLTAVLIQIVSGFRLFLIKRKQNLSNFDKLQIWTGLYLGFFFLIHLSAVLGGRIFLNLDTNFYFGVAGLNTFPFNLFFIPYYAFAILSFFGHLSSIHNKKMKHKIFNLSPNLQAKLILIFGLVITFVIFFGLTNHFRGVTIPTEYNVLIGK